MLRFLGLELVYNWCTAKNEDLRLKVFKDILIYLRTFEHLALMPRIRIVTYYQVGTRVDIVQILYIQIKGYIRYVI